MMKTIDLVKGLAICMLTWASGTAAAQEKGSLDIHIKGVRNGDGKVMVALTDQAIPTNMNFIAADMAKADTAGMTFHFNDLPASTVYIQVFHDENADFRLEMTAEGIPSEGVGVLPGSPERPSVKIDAEHHEIKIEMRYL